MIFALVLAAFALWPAAAHAQNGRGSCAGFISPSPSGASTAKQSNGKPGTGADGLDLANLDRSASPCRDFYQFAAGGWIASHEIPAAYASWGVFNELAQHNQ